MKKKQLRGKLTIRVKDLSSLDGGQYTGGKTTYITQSCPTDAPTCTQLGTFDVCFVCAPTQGWDTCLPTQPVTCTQLGTDAFCMVCAPTQGWVTC